MVLQRYVESLVLEALETENSSAFDEWLSPAIVSFLIGEYAKKSSIMTLDWDYEKTLGSRTWGVYRPERQKLLVSQAKTKGLFRQQVMTILHEIQHWNQHVDMVSLPHNEKYLSKSIDDLELQHQDSGIYKLVSTKKRLVGSVFTREYAYDKRVNGYKNCTFEIDARRFEKETIEDAMKKISKLLSAKVEGGSFDDAIEELFDDYDGSKPLTRFEIGKTLKAYDVNTPENMKHAVEELKNLGVKIAV